MCSIPEADDAAAFEATAAAALYRAEKRSCGPYESLSPSRLISTAYLSNALRRRYCSSVRRCVSSASSPLREL